MSDPTRRTLVEIEADLAMALTASPITPIEYRTERTTTGFFEGGKVHSFGVSTDIGNRQQDVVDSVPGRA